MPNFNDIDSHSHTTLYVNERFLAMDKMDKFVALILLDSPFRAKKPENQQFYSFFSNTKNKPHWQKPSMAICTSCVRMMFTCYVLTLSLFSQYMYETLDHQRVCAAVNATNTSGTSVIIP